MFSIEIQLLLKINDVIMTFSCVKDIDQVVTCDSCDWEIFKRNYDLNLKILVFVAKDQMCEKYSERNYLSSKVTSA